MGYASLVGAEGARNLARLVATGRAYARFADALVKLSEAPERRGTLVFETEATGFQRPRLEVAGAASMVPTSPPWYIDREACAAGPVRVDGVSDDFASVWLIGQPVPPEVALAVAKRFESMEVPATIPRPTVRRTRHVRATPRLVLRLESATAATAAGMPDVDSWARGAWTRVFFDYDGVRVDPSGPDADTRVVGDEVVVVDRSRDEEGHLLFALQDAGLVDAHRAYPEAASLPGTLRALPSVSPYLLESRLSRLSTERVTVEKASDYAFDALEVDDVDLELDEDPDAVDRLGVSVGIRVGGETFAALPLLLAALGEQAPGPAESLVVPLPDGRVVLVPARKLLPLRELLLELAEASSGPVVSRARALALDPAFIKRGPESLRKVREALAAPRAAAIPRALKATLRDYQKEGFRWLMARRVAHLGAVLADDMGLGKTVQTLALLLAERRAGKPSLVVCPKSVLGNWEAEAAKFAPSLRVHVHHGEGRESRLEGFDTADVVLTTYAILLRDAALFEARRFSTVVLDEAQTVKTAASAVTHAACAIPAEFRLALSGTPMENHLGELWSVMRFALPELLGDAKAFTRAFRRPIEREGSEPARRALIARLAPFVLRRRKEQVASELPAKTVVVETIELEEAQRNVYETVRAAMDTRVREALAERGMARSHIIVLDALLKLRQAVCDPRLLPAKTAKKAPSAKLEALIEKLTELVAEGRRVLVFSQFVTMLDLIQKALDRAKLPFLVLTGATEGRTALVREFQSGRVPIFLLSLKAGGTGLNLTAADVVIHYDPWWNPAAEMQATDRAHRIGQDKAVLVYKLVGRDTIEEKILRMQDKKQALFASVLDGQARAAKTLTADDVAFLFSR
jgi:superfamily II DNA or RNA helicase